MFEHLKTAEARKAAQFFYDNAGFSYDPKVETPEQGRERYALALALAESMAKRQGWYTDIESDDHPISSDDPELDGTPAIGVILRDSEGKVLGSLWGIEESTGKDFLRVIAAELASDAHLRDLATCR